MGSFAALVAKDDNDVSESLELMLVTMKHSKEIRLSSEGRGNSPGPTALRMVERCTTNVGLGYLTAGDVEDDHEHNLEQFGYSLFFNGRLYPFEGISDLYSVAERLGSTPDLGIRDMLYEENGAFVVAVLGRDHLLLGRDSMGIIPLYIGENENCFAVASERKALWNIGINNPSSFPPGHIAQVRRSDIDLVPVKTLRQPAVCHMAESEAVKKIQSRLSDAVDIRTRDLQRVAVGFSGGLDSSLLAFLADACGIEVDLITVGVSGSSDLEIASESADELGFSYFAESFDEEDVEQSIDRTLILIEEPDPFKLEVALPILWVSERAAQMDHKALLLGQGCDELFGGYKKYITQYNRKGSEAARANMFEDIARAYERNFERDAKVSSACDVELRLPYADWNLVKLGLSIPVDLKLPRAESGPSKKVLRAVARSLGIPEAIAQRKKKAIQYSTGVDRVLKKKAREEGQSLTQFVRNRFKRVLCQLGIPATERAG